MNERTCQHCGVDISHRRATAKFCRKSCSAMWYQQHETKICKLDGCGNRVRATGLCATHYNQGRASRHRKAQFSCCVCGKAIVRRVDNARVGSHCCSVECRNIRQFGATPLGQNYDWNQDAKQRARAHGCAVVEDVDRLAVLERDQWRCYLCDKDTSAVDDPFHPDSATVDHVVSLSNGGEHTMRNVRCCCLSCNASKANRDARVSA